MQHETQLRRIAIGGGPRSWHGRADRPTGQAPGPGRQRPSLRAALSRALTLILGGFAGSAGARGAPPGPRPMLPFAALWSHLQRRRALRRSVADLHRLDDRMLADIGLTRHEIDVMSAHGPRRRW